MATALGYSTRTEAVLALESQGKPRAEIARLIGIPVKNVSALAISARRSRKADRQQLAPSASIASLLPLDVRETLVRHARKRDVSVERLIIDLLSVIAADHLVNAVLDDRGTA